jgi:NADPH-dependent 2,4-dienoyl-CoA reductase/sulfur reductase-like enzyme
MGIRAQEVACVCLCAIWGVHPLPLALGTLAPSFSPLPAAAAAAPAASSSSSSSVGGSSKGDEEVINCDLVVVGGSVAGLSAAVTAAKEGADTCLLEPTDMLGGQMTANGIPALDFSPEQCYPDTPFNTR